MSIQPTLRRPQSLRSGRTRRVAQRVQGPTVGQCFDIEVSRETDGWMIRIPEIGGSPAPAVGSRWSWRRGNASQPGPVSPSAMSPSLSHTRPVSAE